MTEEEEYIRSLSKERLLMTPHDVYKWQCCVEGCERFNRVLDFGISPHYYWRKKFLNFNLYIFYCGKHWQYVKRGHEDRLKLKIVPLTPDRHLVFEKSIL